MRYIYLFWSFHKNYQFLSILPKRRGLCTNLCIFCVLGTRFPCRVCRYLIAPSSSPFSYKYHWIDINRVALFLTYSYVSVFTTYNIYSMLPTRDSKPLLNWHNSQNLYKSLTISKRLIPTFIEINNLNYLFHLTISNW